MPVLRPSFPEASFDRPVLCRVFNEPQLEGYAKKSFDKQCEALGVCVMDTRSRQYKLA